MDGIKKMVCVLGALWFGGLAMAAPALPAGLVDFTKGYKPAPKANGYSLHLGGLGGIPNGVQKLGRDGNQIYVITVTKGEEHGVLQVGDVILGVNGQPFQGDVIETWRTAVHEAPERTLDGNLRVIRWRNGTREIVDYFTVLPPPDLTKGQTNGVDRKATYNLGPTGLRGWIYTHPKTNLDATQGRTTASSRQILVTHVGTNSPAAGVMEINDVILGVGGKLFTDDARKSFGHAIGEAEKTENKGILTLTRFRKGKIETVQLHLKVMGAYADTAPYDCPKSKRILAEACKILEREPLIGKEWGCINGLALLAVGKPEYLPKVRAYARSIAPKDLHLEGCDTWNWSYKNIFLCEYYGISGDREVLPAIREYTVALARNQSLYGTFGHGGAAKTSDGRLHGSIPPYGPVNMAGLGANLAIVMGKKCGVEDPEVDPAIERAARFFGYYVDKGTIPYGEHLPVPLHENNGKNSMAALLFALQGNHTEAARYFAKMATAAYANREYGHTGQGFSYLWSALGANVGGPDAAAAFFKEASWHLDLARRCDGSFTYDGGEQYGPGKTDDNTYYGKSSYYGISPVATYVLTYALPLKQLWITGKDADPANWLSEQDCAEAIRSGRFDLDRKTQSVPQLVAALGDWSPVVRSWAACELASRPEAKTMVPALMAMAEGSDGHVRQGACETLGYLKDTRALPLLLRLLKHEDRWLRVKAADALKNLRDAAMPVLPEMLRTLVETAEPLQPIVWADPIQLTQGELAAALFDGLLRSSIQGVDKQLLYPAIRTVSRNAGGMARSYLVDTFVSHLSEEDVVALGPDILAAIKEKAPADTMFGNELRMAGAKVLAQYHFAEGVRAIMDYLKVLDGHGSQERAPILLGLLESYGSAARQTVPEIREVLAQYRKSHIPPDLNKLRTDAAEKAIALLEAAQDHPPLRSLGLHAALTTQVNPVNPEDPRGILRQPIPGKLVVLTFDDACRSHADYVGPLLKESGFGGTFYITEFKESFTNKTQYMTWAQIKSLNDLGLEVGNHTLLHWGPKSPGEFTHQTAAIEEHCLTNGIPKPTTFCWPFYQVQAREFPTLVRRGYLFARGGHGRPYRPTVDNPLDAPSFSISDSDVKKDHQAFYKAVKQATPGQVVILTFHGVPDLQHPSVGLEPKLFAEYMNYLKDNHYTVLALRDLAKYVDPAKAVQYLAVDPESNSLTKESKNK